jgi:DNA-binding response OmpR family regulator
MPSILIISRDQDLSVDAAAALHKLGYEVIISTDTSEGLARLRESCTNLVIGDRELPLEGGTAELCLKVRQASYIPVIIVGQEVALAETLESGADAYLAKPPDLHELVARVGRLLRH